MTSGSLRQKGTPNRSTVQTRDRIQELADPIQFLADVSVYRPGVIWYRVREKLIKNGAEKWGNLGMVG